MSKVSGSEDDLLKEIEKLRVRVTELEKSEEKYKIIKDSNYDWEYWENEDNEIAYVSPSCERIIGYSVKELMEKAVLIKDLVYPEDREIWQQHCHDSEQELKLRKIQLRMCRKDGKIRWIEHACNPVKRDKNKFLGFHVSNRDITEWEKVRRDLEYRVNFENLISSISNRFINIPTDEIDTGISFALKQLAEFADIDRSYLFLFSEDGKFMSCTHEWCRDGVEPRMQYLQNIHFEKEYPWFSKRIIKHEVVHIPRFSELPKEAASEKEKWEKEGIISLVDIPMIFNKKLIGFVGFITFREEFHMAEDLVVRMKVVGEMFVNAVIHKQADEKAKERELQLIHAAKMVSLGTLISGAAHEINNPNHYVRLNAEIMERLWNEITPFLKRQAEIDENFRLLGMEFDKITEKVPLILSGMVDGTVRIQRIIESLKTFSRKNTGELNQMIDINVAADNARKITAYLIKKSTDNFTLSLTEELPGIWGNNQQLEQVIINLLTNSCQAMGDMRNGITISTFLNGNKNKLIIEVADEGEGIPPEVLPHIMDPFYTTKRDESNTGLGLSISYNIIKNHGGELTITSECGQWTKARIELPVRQNPERKK